MKYEKLSDKQKAILLLLYDREVNAPKGFKALLSRKTSKVVSLAEIFPGRANKEYKALVEEVQQLEDWDLILAGEKKGRDEEYWAEQTKLRLKPAGRQYIEAYIEKIRQDKSVKKFVETRGAKVSKKTFQKAVEQRPEGFEEEDREDDAWDVAMGYDDE